MKENDGRDAGSSRRTACFGSLGTDFVECDSVLGPASGRDVLAAILGAEGVGRLGIVGGFGADDEDEDAWSWSDVCLGVSDVDLVGGGESGSLSAAKPKRSFDGSFGADDLSGKGALVDPPNKLPFITGVVFFALC